jgi:hypothetical protein
VMHYPFDPGLVTLPAQFAIAGINPSGGLSPLDKTYVKEFYPPVKDSANPELVPFQSVQLKIAAGKQMHFSINPKSTRQYTMQTLGISDTVMVLFEDVDGELRYKAGDDDSGADRNARIRVKLFVGRKYVLRLRLYYAQSAGETAVILI